MSIGIISLTYGTIPEREVFDRKFNNVSGLSNTITFTNDERFGTDTVSVEELWHELLIAITMYNNGNEQAGRWVSDVLFCLGIEWI